MRIGTSDAFLVKKTMLLIVMHNSKAATGYKRRQRGGRWAFFCISGVLSETISSYGGGGDSVRSAISIPRLIFTVLMNALWVQILVLVCLPSLGRLEVAAGRMHDACMMHA
jgi:hypothetical protein